MNTDLSPKQVAAWMREQAAHFTKMAEQIERTFRLNGQAGVASADLPDAISDAVARMGKVLADGRQRRANELAAETGVPEDVVRRITQQSPKFVRNVRGWITLARQPN